LTLANTTDKGGLPGLQPSLPVLFILALALSAAADAPRDAGVLARHQALLDLGTGMRLMCFAAHPDDEDGATLARYRMKFGYTTRAVIATRGEGGQNETGPELYADLAVIRTDEMTGAAQITGAELRFLDLPEFGFSKTLEETYEVWGREETLRRVVREIRLFRPDILITHHGLQRDHGHHQALGDAVKLGFRLAGDPAAFPELRAEGLDPWQPARLYIRVWEPDPSAVTVPIGEYDPALGETYAEVAARALAVHRSQGMEYFIERLLHADASARYLLVDTEQSSTAPVGLVEAPGELAAGLADRVTPEDRHLSNLGRTGRDGEAQAALEAALETAEPVRKARLGRTLAALHGLRLDVAPDDPVVVPGQPFTLDARLQAPPGTAVTFSVENAFGMAMACDAGLSASPHAAAFTLVPDADAPLTIPRAEAVSSGRYPELRGVVRARVVLPEGMAEVEQPFFVDVAPPVVVRFADDPMVALHGRDRTVEVDLLLDNHSPEPGHYAVHLNVAPPLEVTGAPEVVSMSGEETGRLVVARVRIPKVISPGEYTVTARVGESDRTWESRLRVVRVRVPKGRRVGVMQSYDGTLARALEWLGIEHELIGETELTPERLARFDVVMVDIRAYLVRPDLRANNAALLAYVRRGGAAVVHYQKTQEWNPALAPYPLELSRNRVTLEDAPVQILQPGHPLFTTPNRITPDDWDGWIQERGLYFAGEWDEAYTPLLGMSDPGEDIPPGSFLVARHGKGLYAYTALVWYRQLRDGHPGALRLFANMAALKAN
jgi:LmbE family N-acetylglucosaminyl deacetylase